MKPYTVIYSEIMRCGSSSNTVIHMKRVITNNLSELLNQDEYRGNTWMVFEGHPIREGEGEISPAAWVVLTYKF